MPGKLHVSPLIAVLAVFLCLALRSSHIGIAVLELNTVFISFQLGAWIVLAALLLPRRAARLSSGNTPFDQFWYCLTAFVGVHLLGALLNGQTLELTFRTVAWLTVPLYYPLFRLLKDDEIQKAAALALPAYCAITYHSENENLICFSLVELIALASLASLTLFRSLLLAASPWMVIVLTCRGAAIAVFAALTATFERFRIGIAVLSGALFVAGVAVLDFHYPSLLHYRGELWHQGIVNFLQSPIYGLGPNRLYEVSANGITSKQLHTHNFLITLLSEGGLLGFAALAMFVRSTVRAWDSFPIVIRALIAAYLSWSLVDEPLEWWGNNLLFWLALSRAGERRNEDRPAA